MPVNTELLRGSGLALPPGYVTHIGVDPGGSIECESAHGHIRFAWPSMQPRVSSLRRVAEAFGAVTGDFINLEVSGEHVAFSLVRKANLDAREGIDRLLCRLGISSGAADPVMLIGRAVGLDSSSTSVESVRRRLRARGEDELALLLPESSESDADHTSSLDELLNVLSGKRE